MTLTKVERIFFQEKLDYVRRDVMLILNAKEHDEQLKHRNNAIELIDRLLEAVAE